MGDNSFHPPPKLDIHDPNLADSFKRWKRELQVYMAATETDQKPANTQTAIVLNCARVQFIRIYDQFTWENDGDKLLPTKVMETLEGYCAPKRNVVNSFRFWNAEWREPFDIFLTELRAMAELCEYQDEDRTMRDKIVFSTRGKLQELFLRESNLSLEKAIEICRTFETTQKQVHEMNLERQIEKVHNSKPPKITSPQDRKTTDTTRRECQYCGYSHEPSRLRCPAWGKTCSYCHGANHSKAQNAESE